MNEKKNFEKTNKMGSKTEPVGRFNEYQKKVQGYGSRLTASERRKEIADIISFERSTTKARLQEHFGVSKSTIKRDLRELERTGDACFYTVEGEQGGIFACEGWYASRRYLTPRQEAALRNVLDGRPTMEDMKEIERILISFGTPKKL